MAAARFTVTANLVDLIGPGADWRKAVAVVTTNLAPGAGVAGAGGELGLGDGRVTVAQDGSASMSLVDPNDASLNVTGFAYTLHVSVPMAASMVQGRGVVRETYSFGPFVPTSSGPITTWRDQFDTPAVDPTWRDGFRTEMDGVLAAAEAARDEAHDLSQIDTPDALVKALVESPASQTAQALLAANVRTRVAAEVASSVGDTYTQGPSGGCVSFIDDDGASQTHARLRPIFAAAGVPAGAAIITGKVGTSGFMPWSQIDDLVADGWELLGHGYDYANNLTEFPVDADLDFQLGEGCRSELLLRTPTASGFVYPQGVSDARIRRFTRRHYTYAFAGTGIPGVTTTAPLDPLQIRRIGFGSWTDNNPTVNGNSEKSTLAYYKACVDAAKAAGAWLIFMVHVAQQDISQDVVLADLLDYIADQSVPVVTPAAGYARFGYRTFMGDVDAGTWVGISERGITGTVPLAHFDPTIDAIPAANAPSTWPRGTHTQMVTTATATTWSMPTATGVRAGTLITSRTAPGSNHAWTWQEFTLVDGQRWRRHATNATTWGTWVQAATATQITHRVVAVNTYTAAQSITNYTNGSVTVAPNSAAGGTGFPGNGAGVTTTYRIAGPGYDRQDWRKHDSDEMWTRHTVAADNSWSTWVQIH